MDHCSFPLSIIHSSYLWSQCLTFIGETLLTFPPFPLILSPSSLPPPVNPASGLRGREWGPSGTVILIQALSFVSISPVENQSLDILVRKRFLCWVCTPFNLSLELLVAIWTWTLDLPTEVGHQSRDWVTHTSDMLERLDSVLLKPLYPQSFQLLWSFFV